MDGWMDGWMDGDLHSQFEEPKHLPPQRTPLLLSPGIARPVSSRQGAVGTGKVQASSTTFFYRVLVRTVFGGALISWKATPTDGTTIVTR